MSTKSTKSNILPKIYSFFVPGAVGELSDFKKINVEEVLDTNSKKVIVSGVKDSLDSALTIYKSTSKKFKNEVNIKVIFNLTGSEKGDPRRFEEIIPLDDNIEKITFGKERNVIWERGSYIHQEHIFRKKGNIELNLEDLDETLLQLKDIAFREVKNRNLELEKYRYIGFYEANNSNGYKKDEYHVSFSSKDRALYPFHKGNLSKEYPNFTIYIDKDSMEVTGFFYDK